MKISKIIKISNIRLRSFLFQLILLTTSKRCRGARQDHPAVPLCPIDQNLITLDPPVFRDDLLHQCPQLPPFQGFPQRWQRDGDGRTCSCICICSTLISYLRNISNDFFRRRYFSNIRIIGEGFFTVRRLPRLTVIITSASVCVNIVLPSPTGNHIN